MASRQVKINVVAVVLAGVAVGLVTNYATVEVPEWFKDQSHVWLVFGLLVLLSIVIQLLASRDKPEPRSPMGRAWNVPGRNPSFTGRDKNLKALRRLLKKRSRVAVHAVRGMGGVGKTQLALEFCHRSCGRLDVVWWIDAENPTLISDQLRGLGRTLGLDMPPDAAETVQVVQAHLRGLRRWLLVFDNAESVSGLHPFLPSDTGKVLITTRRAGFDAIGELLDLDTMARDESTALLAKRAPDLTPEQADELADLLGDLPLGLEQAAAYLAQSRMPADEYLHLLRTDPDGLSDKGEDQHRRSPDRTLDTLWRLSFERLDEQHEASAQLLAICAYLAPEAIPLSLFTTDNLSHTIGVLTDYSLVKRDGDTIIVHRLVQLAIRGHAAHASPADSEQHPLARTISLLREALPDIGDGPETWPIWARLLPHVLAAVNHHEAAPDIDPAGVSWLLDGAGGYHEVTGQLDQARRLLERALIIDETTSGPDHPSVATSLGNLASVLSDLELASEAKPLLERALAINEAAYGSEHLKVAVSLNNLATVMNDLDGSSTEAKALLERALAIDEAELGPIHPNVAVRLSNLAMVLNNLKEPDLARSFLERALAIEETAHGRNHPAVAVVLNNLSLVLLQLGQPHKARTLIERALVIDETFYRPDHWLIALRLKNLATVLTALGRAAEAEALRKQIHPKHR